MSQHSIKWLINTLIKLLTTICIFYSVKAFRILKYEYRQKQCVILSLYTKVMKNIYIFFVTKYKMNAGERITELVFFALYETFDIVLLFFILLSHSIILLWIYVLSYFPNLSNQLYMILHKFRGCLIKGKYYSYLLIKYFFG